MFDWLLFTSVNVKTKPDLNLTIRPVALLLSATNPQNVFRLYKFPFSPDHHCEKIIIVAIFVNFPRIFKVYNFAHFHVHDRGIAENGLSWLLTSFRE